MKKIYQLIFSIFLLIIGLSGITFFIILSISKENMTNWLLSLFLCIFMVFLGINDIVEYKSDKSIIERIILKDKNDIMWIIGLIIIFIGIILGIVLNVYLGYLINTIGVFWSMYFLIKSDK